MKLFLYLKGDKEFYFPCFDNLRFGYKNVTILPFYTHFCIKDIKRIYVVDDVDGEKHLIFNNNFIKVL